MTEATVGIHKKKTGIKAAALVSAVVLPVLIVTGILRIDQAKTAEAITFAQRAYGQYAADTPGQTEDDCCLYVHDDDYVVAIQNGKTSPDTFRSQRAALQWLYDDPATRRDESMAYAAVETGTQDLLVCTGAFIHISFDDVQSCFHNLIRNTAYASVYDEPFFGWLRELHRQYGARFSLYSYVEVLEQVPDTYQSEFSQASDWLKIGLHADNSETYGNWDYASGREAWNTFGQIVCGITGTYDSLDRMPRLHFYAGSEEALTGMRDAHLGALGFLCADDKRVSYYFDDAIADYLYTNDRITDDNGLIFLVTDMRGDWFAGDYSTSNQYRKPRYNRVYQDLEYRYASDEFASARGSFIFFCHEWKIYNGTQLNGGTQWVEDICRFARDHGIAITYPQEWFFGEGQ